MLLLSFPVPIRPYQGQYQPEMKEKKKLFKLRTTMSRLNHRVLLHTMLKLINDGCASCNLFLVLKLLESTIQIKKKKTVSEHCDIRFPKPLSAMKTEAGPTKVIHWGLSRHVCIELYTSI